MTDETTIKIGTRASKLARLQTQIVIDRLAEKFPQHKFKPCLVSTQGDVHRDVSIVDTIERTGSSGVFVKELEEALLKREVDLVVHSLKDLPAEISSELSLAAVLDRQDPRDVLVSHDHLQFENLPPHSRVATSSRRRAAQLSAIRSDLVFVDIRGNIPTRLKKHQEGSCESMVLAAAGLIRLNLIDRISQFFDYQTLVPAAGQGALAVECRSDNEPLLSMCSSIDEPDVRSEVIAERTVLKLLGGGCSVPIGVLGQIEQDRLRLTGMVASADGTRLVVKQLSGSADEPEALAKRLAQALEAAGAREILIGLASCAPIAVSPP